MRKMCTKCGEEKSLDCFGKKKSGNDGRCSTCKACDSERLKKWRKENVERAAAIVSKWRETNREKMLEQMRRYNAAHSDDIRKRRSEWRKANKDKIAEYAHEYSKTPAGKAALAKGQRKRRAAALNLSIISEGVHWTALLERDGGRCQICGEMIAQKYLGPDFQWDRCDPKSPSVDHVLSISKGGQDTFSNSVLAHRDCNSKKGIR